MNILHFSERQRLTATALTPCRTARGRGVRPIGPEPFAISFPGQEVRISPIVEVR
jgi:hypothetical protein